MANRTKPEDKKATRPVFVKLTPPFKADVDAMAVDTGITTSDRVREHLERDVAEWKKSRGKSS